MGEQIAKLAYLINILALKMIPAKTFHNISAIKAEDAEALVEQCLHEKR